MERDDGECYTAGRASAVNRAAPERSKQNATEEGKVRGRGRVPWATAGDGLRRTAGTQP